MVRPRCRMASGATDTCSFEPPRMLPDPPLAKLSWGGCGSALLGLARRGGSDTPARPKGLQGCGVPPCSCLSLGLISNIPIDAISPPTHLSGMPV